jgi:hypothetical protein
VGLGVIAAQHGAIGQALGVAVFQNPQQGRNALAATLADKSFKGVTVAQALKRFIPGYAPPPRETDSLGEPLPWVEPETNTDLELTMSAVGGKRQQIAALIERRIGFIPGIISKEAMDTGTLNESQRSSGSPGNLLVNGRSSVHAGSGGTLSTIDVCNTPSGNSCPPRVYTNIAVSSDADKTATSVKVNGNPACTEDSIFSKSSGDDPGRCGGVRSGTLRAKAEVVTSASNVLMEGKGALRQFDLMVSNNQNTPPAPVQQGGGARPPFLDTVGDEEKEASPPPWRFDWQVAGGNVKQLGGRWLLQREKSQESLREIPVRKHTNDS